VNYLCFLFINGISYSLSSLVFDLTTVHWLLHELSILCLKICTDYVLISYSERTENDHFH